MDSDWCIVCDKHLNSLGGLYCSEICRRKEQQSSTVPLNSVTLLRLQGFALKRAVPVHNQVAQKKHLLSTALPQALPAGSNLVSPDISPFLLHVI
ncbi:hypothetical protein K493DRAFT_91621 [Basidiobolus meristosporus CBS 931.73]|uniref:Uncharacterized protein n=1 Tax=Basidiobolus meristosporus CBS 931.73 TaxID=1314790 RepID=A0A1Y1X9N9_9FUNG|nr:hypothetical protein K493DRAFT_91621 [Basidiobolus meristosporus CBS 931.73]|eukprot:ORX82491.1 hypothetical protein K493DRAFT_91621 [Basidiobolus meristosporus CBS 931.73]